MWPASGFCLQGYRQVRAGSGTDVPCHPSSHGMGYFDGCRYPKIVLSHFFVFPEVNPASKMLSVTRMRSNVSAANASSVRTGRLWLRLQTYAFTIRKKRKPSFSNSKIHRPNFTISLATPIECASICFDIFPGEVSETKGSFSTLSAYTFTKYRWGDPGGGHGPP
jgi:hypothetical protein